MDSSLIPFVDSDVPQDVLAKIATPIETLLGNSVDANYQGERVLQLWRLQKADLFYRGIQNIAPSFDPASGEMFWTAYGPTAGDSNDPEANERMYDYNPRKTKSYGDKFVAVLGQRPFYNCAAEANDPTSETDKRGARQANSLIQMLQNQWNVKMINTRLCYYLFKAGTTFGKVRPVTDGRKFGFYEVPNIVMQDQTLHPGGFQCMNCGAFTPADPTPMACPQCGAPLGPESYQPPVTGQVPIQQGVNRFPKTSVELDLLNGYIVTVPFSTVELDETPWIRTECGVNKGKLLADRPNSRKIVGEMGGGLAGNSDPSSATASTVRAAAQSQTGTVRSRSTDEWTWTQTWLDATQLQLIPDEEARAIALQYFPDGMYVEQIERKIVAIRNKDYRREFSSCLPAMSDYLFCEGTSWGMFQMEDFFSNLLNVTGETLESGIPKYITNPDYVDVDVINRQRYGPNNAVAALPRAGESLDNAIKVLPTATFPDQIFNLFNTIEGIFQNYYGLLPQVYGDMPSNLTLGQARMMLNQGLMQLGTVADLITHFWEESWTNAVKMYCDVAAVNPTYQGQTIDLDLIKNSSWYIKGGTGIPRSFAERKDMLQEIITQNPQLAQALKIMDPINADKITDYLDLPDLENPDLAAIEATKEIIDQLWQQQPIAQPDGSMGPSIEYDPLVMNPDIAVGLSRAALLSTLGQQRQQSPGYMNVRAFLQAALNAQQANAKPPAEPPKVSFTANLADLAPNQMNAILGQEGISLPPPEGLPISTTADMAKEQHRQAVAPPPPNQAANVPPPADAGQLQPGTPAMQIQ